MKINDLVKELKRNIKKFGNIDVAFFEGSVNPDYEPEYSVHDVNVLGAYKVGDSESNRTKKTLVLVAENSVEFVFGNDPLVEKKAR